MHFGDQSTCSDSVVPRFPGGLFEDNNYGWAAGATEICGELRAVPPMPLDGMLTFRPCYHRREVGGLDRVNEIIFL